MSPIATSSSQEDPRPDIHDKDGYHGGRTPSDLALAPPAGHGALARLAARTTRSLEDAIPPNTRRAYAGDLQRFALWCRLARLPPMPAAAGTIALYLRQLADQRRRMSTIERALAAVCAAHQRA